MEFLKLATDPHKTRLVLSAIEDKISIPRFWYDAFNSFTVKNMKYLETLEYVHYDHKRQAFVCTDGKRMLVHFLDEKEQEVLSVYAPWEEYFEVDRFGKNWFFKPVKKKDLSDIGYPPWYQVIPEYSTPYIQKVEGENSDKLIVGVEGHFCPDSVVRFCLHKAPGVVVDSYLMKKVLRDFKTFQWKAHPTNPRGVLYFELNKDPKSLYLLKPVIL